MPPFTKFYPRFFLFCLAIGVLSPKLLGAGPSPVVAKSIFDLMYLGNNEVLDISLETDVSELIADKYSETYYPAFLTFASSEGDSLTYPVNVRMRGRFRRRVCDFPPLKLKFPEEFLEATGFNPRYRSLKLVTHCLASEKESRENVLLEYLAYKLFQEITDNAFRVQLVRIQYIDRQDASRSSERWGFIIEDPDQVADRAGGRECEEGCMNPLPASLDMKQVTQVALFQYMIGNADYSFALMRNLKLIEFEDARGNIVVPYDFDFAGLIGAAYAIPNTDEQLTDTRQRAYLGLDVEDPIMQWALNYFKFKRDAILEAIDEFELLRGATRRQAKQYVESFFVHLDRMNVNRSSGLYDTLATRPLPYPLPAVEN